MGEDSAPRVAEPLVSDPVAPRGITHRARGFVKGRSGKQKVTGLAAVAVLVTAPFGGLQAVADPGPARLRLGVPVDVGPFDVTVRKVESLSDLKPAISPRPGNRLFLLDVVVTNHTDAAEQLGRLTTEIFGAQGTGAVPFRDSFDGTVAPRVFDVEDTSEIAPKEYLVPGTTQELAVVLEVPRPPDRVTVSVSALRPGSDDQTTLAADNWLGGGPLVAQASLPVQVKQ